MAWHEAGGFSQRATGRFVADMLADARRRPPRPAEIDANNTMTPQSRGTQNNDERRVTMNSVGAQARVDYVLRNPLLMTAIRRIFDNIVSGGVEFEFHEGEQRFEDRLGDEQRKRISQQVRDAAETMYIHWIANGYAVLQTQRMAEDKTITTIAVLEANEYTLTWTKRSGWTRKYVVNDAGNSVPVKCSTLAVHRAPDGRGRVCSDLLSMQELLDIGTSLLRDYYHGHYHCTHPLPITEPTASAGRNDRAEVMGAPHYIDGDNQQAVEGDRVQIIQMHADEQNMVVDELMDAKEAAASETLLMLANATGMVTDYHPTVEAILNPPHRTVMRLPLDRRMAANAPVPRLDGTLPIIEQYIMSLVYALVGAPPEMRGDVKEKTAQEVSILWRYYNNAVRGLQDQLSQFLSLALHEMSAAMFEDMFMDDFDRSTPPCDDEARELARTTQRGVAVKERLERVKVRVRFVHVPTIAPEAIEQLHVRDIISDDTAAKYMAAYHGIPMDDILTPAEREKQRKRRQERDAKEAQTLATASTVGKERGKAQVERQFPDAKRRAGGSD